MDDQAQKLPQAALVAQYAGVGIRFLALFLDIIIIGMVIGILEAIFGIFMEDAGVVIGGGLGTLIALVYIFYLEAIYGATVGKRILGLRVVQEDGSPIGWKESIIRNLLRIIDSLFFYLVGAILIWTSPRKQRLGDRIAHTVVIKAR